MMKPQKKLHFSKQDLTIYPASVPKVLIHSLIIGCVLLGLSSLRQGQTWQDWLNVLSNWCFMLLWIPLGITLCALPFKWRDHSFELKLVYYFGMFVAFLYMLNRLRYWH